jgi:hypothetical protein
MRVLDVKTEAWMVASSVGDRMVILSPRVWKTQAVEHIDRGVVGPTHAKHRSRGPD